MHNLFRREVLEARRTSGLGAISLVQPVRLWVLTATAVAIALAVALFLIFGTYTRRSRVIGQLVPSKGLATVLAPLTGVVSRLEIAEGEKVQFGQTLVVVSVPRATIASGDTLTALEERLERREASLKSERAAQQQLLTIQTHGTGAQLAVARRELTQVDAEIETRQEQVRLAVETLSRMRRLLADKYVSELQVTQQKSAVLEQRGELQILQRQATALRRLITQLQQVLYEVPGQQLVTNAGFQRDLALLEQERLETQARSALAVSAPVSGVVATQLVKPGQAVQAGQPLMSLLPRDGKLEAELLVPSRAIGFIEPGDRVLLRYQAFPYQKFGHHQGRVARISRSALSPTEASPLVSSRAGEPFYRVTVSLPHQSVTAYGKAEPLKPGMLLDADVLGEHRTLIEWVLEPIYSIQGTAFGR
jgi:membrane fusion protein